MQGPAIAVLVEKSSGRKVAPVGHAVPIAVPVPLEPGAVVIEDEAVRLLDHQGEVRRVVPVEVDGGDMVHSIPHGHSDGGSKRPSPEPLKKDRPPVAPFA